MHWSTVGTGAAVAALAVLCVGPVSAQPPAPQPGIACSADVADAMTLTPGARIPLRCSAGSWQPVTEPYPVSDRWVSAGPVMTVRGGARQNPQIEPGEWTATPLAPTQRCRAEQVSVTYGRVDGPPRVDQAPAGQQLGLEVVPRLLDIQMSGDCLWQRVATSP